MALPAFTAARRAAAPLLLSAGQPPLSIDISYRHRTQQQTRRTGAQPPNDVTDGQTDRQTDERQTVS